MPVITPVSSLPSNPDSATAGTCTFLSASAGIDLMAQVTAGTETFRPYFWWTAASAWCPLGGDAAAGVGTSEVTATAATLNDCAHGRYVGLGKGAHVVVKKGSGGGTVACVEITERIADPR